MSTCYEGPNMCLAKILKLKQNCEKIRLSDRDVVIHMNFVCVTLCVGVLWLHRTLNSFYPPHVIVSSGKIGSSYPCKATAITAADLLSGNSVIFQCLPTVMSWGTIRQFCQRSQGHFPFSFSIFNGLGIFYVCKKHNGLACF